MRTQLPQCTEVIVHKIGQDVYAVQVGDSKILDRDHTRLQPRAPAPSGLAVLLDFTAADQDSDNDGKEDDDTAERILRDKSDPTTLRGRLFKGRWRRFAASQDSWEPLRALCRGIPRCGRAIARKRGLV